MHRARRRQFALTKGAIHDLVMIELGQHGEARRVGPHPVMIEPAGYPIPGIRIDLPLPVSIERGDLLRDIGKAIEPESLGVAGFRRSSSARSSTLRSSVRLPELTSSA